MQYGYIKNLEQLGLSPEEITDFINRIYREYGSSPISADAFIFECVRHLNDQVKKLKDEIACMKTESSS